MIEICRGLEFFYEVVGHRLVGLVMTGELFEDRGLFQPMLIELRRQFYEITLDAGSGE